MTGKLIRLDSAIKAGEESGEWIDADRDDWRAQDFRCDPESHEDCPEDIWPGCEWLPLAGPDWEPLEWWEGDGLVGIEAQAPRPASRAVFYIDGDNQPPRCAAELVSLFGTHPGVCGLSAVIAGNSRPRIDAWARGLRAVDSEVDVVPLLVPERSQAADLAIIMELGARLHGHGERDDLLVVVSRDDLLVGAAEHAKAQGCRAVAAYEGSGTPPTRGARVATILLPAPDKTESGSALVSGEGKLGSAGPSAKAVSKRARVSERAVGPGSTPDEVLATLRDQCKSTPDGRYLATEVGQVLWRLGFDAKARKAFLTGTPGIELHGSGANNTKAYRF